MSGETSAVAFCARYNGRLSDKALIKFIADGDKDALKLLYLRHGAQIYQFVLRLNGSESVADEAVNQVFLAVWRDAGQFKGESQVGNWLLGIARSQGLPLTGPPNCLSKISRTGLPPGQKAPEKRHPAEMRGRISADPPKSCI
jgi:hypothetical protein